MVLAPIEVMYGIDELNKVIKPCGVLLLFTHLGHVAEIFKPLGVSLGASLESRM